jgi:heptosyltransferase-2
LDRLGDVVLSTPVLQRLRERFPQAFIAMMVRPPCRDVVDGHPAVNDVIVYDKEGAHRSPLATWRFARQLRGYGFDTALVLHPSNRSHWIPWLAGIPTRIGFARKQPWLLTHPMPHTKQEGAKHEAVYTLELLACFGIPPGEPVPFVPLQPSAVDRVNVLLADSGVRPDDPLVVIHPSASCVSKRWMPERFAAVADRLIAGHGVTVCLVAGDASDAAAVRAAMRHPVIDLSGRLSVAELAAVLHRGRVLISNDSGPVHLAAALGVPVVDIFGRNQAGLSPLRWGPLGAGHTILHKEVGCDTCLAHRCQIEFLCLTRLEADEVCQAAVRTLEKRSEP